MDLVAHYAEIRKRITQAPHVAAKLIPPKVVEPPPPEPVQKEGWDESRIEQVQRRMPLMTQDLKNSITYVLLAHDLTWEQITGRGRIKPYVMCRRSIVWLLRCQDWSTPRIGRLMKRDHTSILHALNAVNPRGREQ